MNGAAPLWLVAAGILLTYAVLGAPMRSAARLLGVLPGPAKGAVVDVVASLVLRGLLLAAFVALFSLPYLAAIGAVALIAFAAFRLGRSAPAPRETSADSLSAHLAEAMNDPLGAAAGLAALALRPAQSPCVRRRPGAGARRLGGPDRRRAAALRATRLRAAIAAAALAAAPRRSDGGRAAGLGLGRRTDGREVSIVPVVLAGAALAAGLALAKPSVS